METTNVTENVTENATPENTKGIADAIFDLGLTWAEYGLAQGTAALEHTSRALAKSARALDAIRTALKTDAPKTA